MAKPWKPLGPPGKRRRDWPGAFLIGAIVVLAGIVVGVLLGGLLYP